MVQGNFKRLGALAHTPLRKLSLSVREIFFDVTKSIDVIEKYCFQYTRSIMINCSKLMMKF
jgi:hypothetical protein